MLLLLLLELLLFVFAFLLLTSAIEGKAVTGGRWDGEGEGRGSPAERGKRWATDPPDVFN
jgi:hypothetical protein